MISKSELNSSPTSKHFDTWIQHSIFIAQKFNVFRGLKFIVDEPLDNFSVSVDSDCHRVIKIEPITLTYIFRIFNAIWRIINEVIVILLIFCIIFVINDSNVYVKIISLNDFYMKSKWNIEINFLEKCKCILISSLQLFSIETVIVWISLVFTLLH